MNARSAPQSLSELSATASNTGCRSNAERLITWSTSERGGLLLERFAQILSTLSQLAKQPRILDGDHGLTGEILHQRDLLVGEGATS